MAKPLAGELGGIPGGSTGAVHTAAGSLGKFTQALPGVSQPDRRAGSIKTSFFLNHPGLFPLAHIALFGALHLTQLITGIHLPVILDILGSVAFIILLLSPKISVDGVSGI